MKEKEKKTKPLSATEEEPLKNLAFLLLLIPATPFLLIFNFVTGKAQNSFILGSGLSILLTGLSIYGLIQYSQTTEYENVALNSMVEELDLEQKQKLQEEFSTLRTSIGAEKFPKELEPILDIPQNMLIINYYNYLVNSSQLGERGEGSIFILQNSLYGEDKALAKASWQALHNIGTEQAKFIMFNFKTDVENLAKLNEEKAKRALKNQKRMPESNSLKFYKEKFKNKINILKNKF